MSSLLDLTSAGPYAAAITSVFPRKYDTHHNNNKYGTFYMCWLLFLNNIKVQQSSHKTRSGILLKLDRTKNATVPCEKLADPSVLFKRHCSQRIDLSSDENLGTATSLAPSAILNLLLCSRARVVTFLFLVRVGQKSKGILDKKMDFFSLWLVLSFQLKIKNHLNFLSESELYFFIFCLFFTLQHKYGLKWQFLTLPLYYFTIDNENKMAAATWMLVRASARATFIGSRGKISHLRTLPNALRTLRVS